jgi:hypothetical protein
VERPARQPELRKHLLPQHPLGFVQNFQHRRKFDHPRLPAAIAEVFF